MHVGIWNVASDEDYGNTVQTNKKILVSFRNWARNCKRLPRSQSLSTRDSANLNARTWNREEKTLLNNNNKSKQQ